MNRYVDNSRLEEKLIDVTLPSEIVYKENKGESISPQLRHGRLDDNLYINRKNINTRYGKLPIKPQIKLYFRAFTDRNSIITVDMYNAEDKCLFKKFTIKSENNNFSINDMKTLCDDIKTILFSEESGLAIKLIEYIRNKENLIFDEIAQ